MKTKKVFLYGVPRGGTNLFCALLHNHPKIFSLAHNGTKKYLNSVSKQGSNINILELCQENSIYKKGGLRKNFEQISHLVFDKVHYDRNRHFFM